jgi:hypothetical protein
MLGHGHFGMPRVVLGEDEGDKIEREGSFCVSLPINNHMPLALNTRKEEEKDTHMAASKISLRLLKSCSCLVSSDSFSGGFWSTVSS